MQKYIIFIVVAAIIIIGAMMLKSDNKPAAVVTETQTASSTEQTAQEPVVSGTEVTNPKPITMKDGLIIEDTKIGNGEEAKAGMLASVHYVGTLTNGTKFDSSRDRGEPFQFPLGQGYVIKGWDEGVVGMKVGGIRKLTIPSELGYGTKGAGSSIPPNATLKFEVELLGLRSN